MKRRCLPKPAGKSPFHFSPLRTSPGTLRYINSTCQATACSMMTCVCWVDPHHVYIYICVLGKDWKDLISFPASC